MRRYAPRPIHPHGVREHDGGRLKRYTITWDAGALDWADFEPGIALALAELPRPAAAGGRPGVGFVIAHRGRGADYLVLGWWDRENELPLRVFVREGEGGWRPARGGESVCVWDLQVIAFERDAYVATLMDAACADPVAAYLARTFHVEPASSG